MLVNVLVNARFITWLIVTFCAALVIAEVIIFCFHNYSVFISVNCW